MSRLKDPLVAMGLLVAVLAVTLFAGQIVRGMMASGRTAKAEVHLGTAQAGAAAATASDAVNTVASSAASEAAIDAVTMENDRAIRSAPGAAAPVDPGVRNAGLVGLCKRAAYLRDQRCLQFTPAR